MIARLFSRPPDFVIGDNYLRRWRVLPRNRWFNIYLHKILHSDDDRALHDHPWWNVSIILKGEYVEVVPADPARPAGPRFLHLIRKPFRPVFRRARQMHRLVVEKPTWSLFITGPSVRTWGFACPQGWRPWWEFVNPDDPGKPGKGCGE